MFTTLFAKKVGLSFVRAFVPVFVLGLTGAYEAIASGNVTAAKSALIAVAVAAGAAGLRAAQALFTTLETRRLHSNEADLALSRYHVIIVDDNLDSIDIVAAIVEKFPDAYAHVWAVEEPVEDGEIYEDVVTE